MARNLRLNTTMKRRLIALVFALSLSGTAQAADVGHAASLAGRMMALMWEAMVMFFSGMPGGYGIPVPGGGWNNQPWPGQGAPGWNWSQGQPADAYPNGPVGLNGLWYSQSGEWLGFEGDRFRLGRSGRAVDGRFRLAGNRMVTHIPRFNTSTEYRFARRGDLLVLGDRLGRTLLFRRVQ